MNNDDLITIDREIKEEFPDYRMINKSESLFMKTIDFTLKLMTFWRQRSFMDQFVTTIGNTVYVPNGWERLSISNRMTILRHERVHMRQSRRVGRILFSLSYLMLPLPAVFAVYRRKFEQEAYEESMVAVKEYYGFDLLLSPDYRSSMLSHFTSAEYFWMWPWKKSLDEWYDSVVEKLRKS